MRVEFQSGEVFDGPWTDDPTIQESVTAYRRLNSDWVALLENGHSLRVRSSAFQPHRDSNAISVTLSDKAEELNVDPSDVALGEFAEEYGLATFAIHDARELGFSVVRVPLSVDPAHAMLFVTGPESDEPHRNRCRKLGKKLAPHATVVLPPP